MKKWVAEKIVGKCDERKDVESDEIDDGDGMYMKCCDAGRGTIELC